MSDASDPRRRDASDPRRRDASDPRPRDASDPQRRVAWLNRFFVKIVGPAQVDSTRPGGYHEDEHLRHERLAAMGLELRTDANGHSYVVDRTTPPDDSVDSTDSDEQ